MRTALDTAPRRGILLYLAGAEPGACHPPHKKLGWSLVLVNIAQLGSDKLWNPSSGPCSPRVDSDVTHNTYVSQCQGSYGKVIFIKALTASQDPRRSGFATCEPAPAPRGTATANPPHSCLGELPEGLLTWDMDSMLREVYTA